MSDIARPVTETLVACPQCTLAASSRLWMFCEAEVCPMRSGGGEPRIVRPEGYTSPPGTYRLNRITAPTEG